jgi:hypothetical protein
MAIVQTRTEPVRRKIADPVPQHLPEPVRRKIADPVPQHVAGEWKARGLAAGAGILGLAVVDCREEQIGLLHDFMLDLRTGRIAYGVVVLDHAPEWSERVIAVPWNAMSLDPEGERFRINARRDWIERAPSMRPEAMLTLLDHEYAVLIHSFFGARPYWEPGGQQHS